MIAAPFLHSSLGFWDEIVSLAGAVIILILIVALVIESYQKMDKK